MPQLDTSPWLISILSMMFTLYLLMPIKISKILINNDINCYPSEITKSTNPWNNKWTKIYLPHSLPLH
uniref:ATP synthase complex subunit 8 n=1 Tax=Echinops telfairi TaxID=9371 RepID=Q7YD94_ECHTE|nr:ATPase subunit 8 [Echinops telfairi]